VAQGPESAEDRLRTAITAANNEIFHQAQLSPELAGMGCVLTVAMVAGGVATIGHVGDTRLYKFHHGTTRKITRDHSPVGEQEDSGELAEAEAMRHPKRNQVYRALGATKRRIADDGFVEIHRLPFEADSALLLCTDGLTDLVRLRDIESLVERHAGDPDTVVERLIAAANQAGGKDNVSVVLLRYSK
jgi:serine/threonine protein phosphatase PrpC